MKKIIKSRIFIVIITMIICISGTLYATTKYQASEILYNTSNGETMNVNEALNEIYENMNKSNIGYADFKINRCAWKELESSVTLITYNVETTGTVLLTWYSMIYTTTYYSGRLYATLYLNDKAIDSMQITDTNSNTTAQLNQSNQLEVNVKKGDILKTQFYINSTNSISSSFLMGNYIK